MISSKIRKICHDPREIEPVQRGVFRLNGKNPASHFRISSSSTGAKMTKIVKSYSYTEKACLEINFSLNKDSSQVIMIHQDSETSKNKSKSSSKMPFWGSPELSLGI
jgi:hypothetical protein